MKIKIIGTGKYIPQKIYTNQYLESIVDTNKNWIHETLGIKQRHIAFENQKTSDMALFASLDAINNANITIDDIDLIILATSTPDVLAPSTATIVQHKLNAMKAVAFDIFAVCSGFIFAVSIATKYLQTGKYKTALVIGADAFSKVTDWQDRNCVYFGDGAGAVILSISDNEQGFEEINIFSGGNMGSDGFVIPIDYNNKLIHNFNMTGKLVYNSATKLLPRAILQILQCCKLTVSDIDFVIPHQPSIKILEKIAEQIHLPFERIMTNMQKYGNTGTGCIPILLDQLKNKGLFFSGQNILFVTIGAGWTWGVAIYKC